MVSRLSMRFLPLIFLLSLIVGCLGQVPISEPTPKPPQTTSMPTVTAPPTTPPTTKESTIRVVGIPPKGQIYHAVFPGGVNEEEDEITPEGLSSYERMVEKSATWVYFSLLWDKIHVFHTSTGISSRYLR